MKKRRQGGLCPLVVSGCVCEPSSTYITMRILGVKTISRGRCAYLLAESRNLVGLSDTYITNNLYTCKELLKGEYHYYNNRQAYYTQDH